VEAPNSVICGSSAQVIGFPEIPSKPPPRQAPGLQINAQHPSASCTGYSRGVGQPTEPAQPAPVKDVARRTPPSRPAPLAPKPPVSQVRSCAAVLQMRCDGRFVPREVGEASLTLA